MKTVRLSIAGLGNVGRRLLELIEVKRDLLRARYDLELRVVAAFDTSGGAENRAGLDAAKIIALKREKKGIAAYPQFGRADRRVIDAARPLVLAYAELAALARANGAKILHSATVTGGLPTLNIGTRDLGASVIEKFEGIVNGTTNYILARMTEGQAFDTALKHAQEIGMAEADPALDVDGWDAANKLVIIANAVLNYPTTLKDLTVEGIREVTQDEIQHAAEHRQVIKLIASAEKIGNHYRLSVRPTRLELVHPLAGVGAGMMAVIYHTDINGTITALIQEHDPYPTAAAVLRDILQVASEK
ncbi:MAG: homoserine dehydrogenase [Chloroflexi bacterium]|nr:homoserine dehydrogenase [Chloroflexota bacterium]